MHRYFIKTPWWARAIFSSYIWRIPSKEKVVYLTFDDGPHPTITPWVLDLLRQYGAKATFFCIGENVEKYREVYQRILKEDHAIGNHTFHHLNGWVTSTREYVDNTAKAARVIESNLFRPPYGKIKAAQAKGITRLFKNTPMKIVMWDVLSADFDTEITPEKCLNNVLKNVEPGSVVVFHDSEKAFPNLKETLPSILKRLSKEGYKLERIIIL